MIKTKTISSGREQDLRTEFYNHYKNCPIPETELLANISLFEKRQDFVKQLFLHELYKEFLPIHGCIMEFGVRWGRNLTTLIKLRSILEPYNYGRKIIGFDTFDGFSGVDEKDGTHSIIEEKAFGVTGGYENYLMEIMKYHESEAPLSHITKIDLRKGDATLSLQEYLLQHPETIIAFAYFDFDIYTPTKRCLEMILPHLTKGSVIGFDELTDPHFPGETIALKEVLGTTRYSIRRNNYCALQSYLVIE